MKTLYHQNYPLEQVEAKSIDIDLLKRLWEYLNPYRMWLAFAVILLLISKIVEVIIPIAIGKLTQQFLDNADASQGVKDLVLQEVFEVCAVAALFLILSYFFEVLNVYIKASIGQKALYRLRVHVYERIQHLPLKYFDKHAVGRLMTRTIHDVDQIDQMFSESVVPLLGNLFLFLSITTAIFYLNWRLGLMATAFMIVIYFLTNHFRYHQRICYDRIRSIVSAMNTFVQEHLMGATIIRSFGVEKKERLQFEEMNEDHCNAYLEAIENFSFFVAGIDILQSVFLIVGFLILSLFSFEGFQAGTFFTLSLYGVMFFRPLTDLAERYNILQAAMAAGERIFNILDQPVESHSGKKILDEIESIEFENVWFAYENEDWVLKGLSLKLIKGESVAFVGVTGSGKTSIMNLLLGFYPFQKGEIRINGTDIREYELKSLRSQFSIVLQDPVIFSGTVAENISLYHPSITKEQIQNLIEYLQIDSLISRLPGGLDYPLKERGKSLSLGEMQLISMARAVAAKGKVLILDEATSNIDTATEKVIQEALTKILKKRTAIIIAHRLSTIKDVDRIIVLHQGIVAESGSHPELLRRKGIYEKLYRLQFLGDVS